MGYSAVRARIDDASTGGGHDDAHDSHDGATAPARPAPTRGWRWLAAASILGFALLFGRVLLQGQPSWQPMAALAQANAPTQWQVERTRDSSRIRLRTVGEAVAPNGGSYELWVVPAAGGAPVSLGILPARGEVARLLNAQQQALLQTAQNVAVSLEPGGGSRNGAPTTVLFAAPVAAVT
jgi:anti-sigma-K factor RskA